MIGRPPSSTLFPYATPLRLEYGIGPHAAYTVPLPVLGDAAAAAREHGMLLHLHVAETAGEGDELLARHGASVPQLDRKSTRLNSSHANISYAVFCLKKKYYH